MKNRFSLRQGMLYLFTLLLLCTWSCEKENADDDYKPSPEILDLLTRTSWKLVRWQERLNKGDALKDVVLPACMKDDVYTFKKGSEIGGVFELNNGPIKCYAYDPAIMVTSWEYTRENELYFNNFGHLVLTLSMTSFVITKDNDQHDVYTYVRTN